MPVGDREQALGEFGVDKRVNAGRTSLSEVLFQDVEDGGCPIHADPTEFNDDDGIVRAQGRRVLVRGNDVGTVVVVQAEFVAVGFAADDVEFGVVLVSEPDRSVLIANGVTERVERGAEFPQLVSLVLPVGAGEEE